MDMFDTVVASEAGAWLHLTNQITDSPAYLKTDAGKDDLSRPCRIKLIGPDSKAFRAKQKKRAAALVKQRGKNNDISKMTEAEIAALIEQGETSQIDDAVDATVGWENLPGVSEFSPAAVRALYEKYPGILREVVEFKERTANFTASALKD